MSAIEFIIRGMQGKTEVFYNPSLKDCWTDNKDNAFAISLGRRARSLADELAESEKDVKHITVWRK